MAKELLVAGAGDLINRLISFASEQLGLLCGVDEEVKKLGRVLEKVQAVLCDAEKRQVESETVKLWLKDLKDMACDAEDILDEIAYEDLRYKVEKIENSKKRKFSNLLSPSNIPLALRSNIVGKIGDFNKKLENIKLFQLVSEPQKQNLCTVMDRETTSLVDDSAVVGRADDKSQIVDMLIHGSSDQESSGTLSVVPIVGLGGLGKTTLAQLVYNDEVVEKHFDLRIWICVSDDFVITGLWNQILKQITTGTCESPSKQELQNNLLKQLSGKKFLLVVDDVWNEDPDKWEGLILPLKCGSAGSKIIVTTRSTIVASVVGTVPKFDLQVLSENYCWDLFQRRAFKAGGPEKTSALELIGKEIVKKCGGVPLAVKSLGGLMHSKRQENQWLAVQNSEIWNLPDQQNKIIEVLRLSYDDLLLPGLKQCFSYCAIFPKDRWIYRGTLIELWMAQGLLGTSMMEDTGNEYFNILYSKSFFQDAAKNYHGDIERCKMHDLVHDLAQSITKSECQVVVANEKREDLSRCRQATLTSNRNMPTVLEDLNKANKLRTIFSGQIAFDVEPPGVRVRYDTFFNLRLLRVLDLSGSMISEIPSSISKLILLRYLDLSHTSIVSLPKCVTCLYHLQTLKLNGCIDLSELPDDLRNLISLRHLWIDSFGKWNKMPREIGQLRFLQTLPVFKVGEEDDGRGIAELECLNDLRGRLWISYLDQVKDLMSAKKANLMGKRNIQDLTLEWNDSDNRDENHVSVLEGLQPHPNLKSLNIFYFRGVIFSRWVTSGSALPSLVRMLLHGCHKCEHIPSLGELPNLEVLQIAHMSSVKHFGGLWNDSGTSVATIIKKEEGGEADVKSKASYPSLKSLILTSIPNLEEWSENVGFNFPCLKELFIKDCPNLRKVPRIFPSLKILNLFEVGGMGVQSITSSLTSLTSLTIDKSEDLSFLTEGLFRKNKDLEHLEIARCPKLQAFLPDDNDNTEDGERMQILLKSSLSVLRIFGCPALTSMPDVRGLTSLQELVITGCTQLENIPKGFLDSLSALENLTVDGSRKLKIGATPFPSLRKLRFCGINAMVVESDPLRSLTELSIHDIQEFTRLPEEFLQNSKHLLHLSIKSCPTFQAFPSNTVKGEQIIHSLETLEIFDCPSLSSMDLGGLVCLRRLKVSSCEGLKSLQGLQFLTALEKLEIGSFSEFLVVESDQLRSLAKLSIVNSQEFTRLPAEFLHNRKHLQHLSIKSCPKFQGFPSTTVEGEQIIHSLETLEICDCPSLSSVDLRGLVCLRQLEVRSCEVLKSLQGLQFLTALKELRIGPFSEELHHFPFAIEENHLISSLRILSIDGWSNLKSLPHQLQHLTTLKSLEICNFNGLTALPEWLGKLASLERLQIRNCANLMHLPSKEEMQRLASLSQLLIINCPLLRERCCRAGAEWHKMSHIRFLYL